MYVLYQQYSIYDRISLYKNILRHRDELVHDIDYIFRPIFHLHIYSMCKPCYIEIVHPESLL